MKTSLEQPKETIGLATETDIPSVAKLQQANLKDNLTEEEKVKEGFVSLATTEQDLKNIMEQGGVFVVCKQGNALKGYLFSMTLDYAKTLSFLDPLIENISALGNYKEKKIDEYKYCILAQIVVEKNSRGAGISEKLYARLRTELLSRGYELGVSEIAENNEKSLGVHLNKLGLKRLGTYNFNSQNWVVVALDLKE